MMQKCVLMVLVIYYAFCLQGRTIVLQFPVNNCVNALIIMGLAKNFTALDLDCPAKSVHKRHSEYRYEKNTIKG